jgi:hypothetical protein
MRYMAFDTICLLTLVVEILLILIPSDDLQRD